MRKEGGLTMPTLQSNMTVLPQRGREWHLIARPEGWPAPGHFALREAALPTLSPGQVLVRNLYLSVDPYMRRRMDDVESYVPPFALDEPMDGAAIGVVLSTQADGLAVGDHVRHGLGWREYAVVDARSATLVDDQAAPLPAYLGPLGNPGLTAYAGLKRIAEIKRGDVVFVSAAAGAVGSLAGQIARLLGASRVIGSAGSAEKARILMDEYGYDAVIDYKAGPIAPRLAEAAPDGIDVYFDNVGGEHLEAAISAMNPHGRIVLCGMIAQYNTTDPATAPGNLLLAVNKRLRMEGMLVGDHPDLAAQYARDAAGWIREGSLRYRETIVDGIENTPEAFIGLLRGENTGKMIVRLDD
jgi:NADPH-dependent curcumin reductase CurA